MNDWMTLREMQEFLGLGRSRTLRLCQERTHNFPSVKVGNKWQALREYLSKWRDDWLAGKFTI